MKDGGFAKFMHRRKLTPIDEQTVIRMNRDTLYSGAVFDLDAGAVTIALPEAHGRFMSMQVIDEDEYTDEVDYKPGGHIFTKLGIGTRYMLAVVRTWLTQRPKRRGGGARLAGRNQVRPPGGPGVSRFKLDLASQKTARDALLVLASQLPDTKGMFGSKKDVDPVRHLIGAASAGAATRSRTPFILNVTPAKNDGATIYKLDVKDVPVDGFWSMSVYDAKGYFAPNPENAYTLNNITAKKAADGSISGPVRRLRRQKFRTVCRRRRAGTIWSAFIARGKRSSTASTFPTPTSVQ